MTAPIDPSSSPLISPTAANLNTTRPLSPGDTLPESSNPTTTPSPAPEPIDTLENGPPLKARLHRLAARARLLLNENVNAHAVSNALTHTTEQLAELRALVDSGAIEPRDPDNPGLQRAIGKIRTIADSIRALPDDPSAPRFRTLGFAVESPNLRAIESVSGRAHARVEPFDVNVSVQQPTEPGAFRIAFGSLDVDLAGPDEQFVINVAGPRGARELSFASGTTIADIAATINSFTSSTGVVAGGSGGTLGLYSADYGAEQFVSVDIIDDGGLEAGASVTDVYGHEWQGVVETGAHFSDEGRDLVALVNGQETSASGRTISLSTPDYDLAITLSHFAATRTGEHLAFRFVPTSSDAIATPFDGEPLDSGAIVADANRTLQNVSGELRAEDPTTLDPATLDTLTATLEVTRADLNRRVADTLHPRLADLERQFNAIRDADTDNQIRDALTRSGIPATASPLHILSRITPR